MRVFDMHCDTLTVCKKKGWDLDNENCQLRLGDADGFDSYVQLYAVFIPDEVRGERAQSFFGAHHAYYRRQLEHLGPRLYDVPDLAALQKARDRRGMSSILAVEGGCVYGGELGMVEQVYNAGVRSVTLTWNGNNELAGGVMDDGRLTDFGKEAVHEMERLGIAVDVSHLNDESFYDVLAATEKPVFASHSNSRAVCSHPRNLTDDQFCHIAERGGVVGLNFYKQFIADGGEGATFDQMLAHLDHLLQLGGENVLALGSDYDGADIEEIIDRPRKLKNFYQALLDNGFGRELADKIFYWNAYGYFERLLAGEL